MTAPAPDKSAGCPTCEHDLGEHRVDDLGSFCMIYDCPCAASVSLVEILGAVIGAAAREQVAVVNAAAPASEKPIVNCGCGNPAIHGSENCWPHSYPAPAPSERPFGPDTSDTIAALRAEVERLTRERDEANEWRSRWCNEAEAHGKQSNVNWERYRTAEARVAALEAALRKIAERHIPTYSTNFEWMRDVANDHRRIARAALEGR